MVRNAFARADDIHMRATSAGCSESPVPDGSPVHSDTEMDANSTSSPGSNMSESTDTQNEPSCGHGQGNVDGGARADDGIDVRIQSGDPADVSEESSNPADEAASNDGSSNGEDLEDLLGQIPHLHMGSNPELDVAATLPLYEGATLSMLCATLLIVNCCKTHGASNMFMNELLMLLSMSILPVGNCFPSQSTRQPKFCADLV